MAMYTSMRLISSHSLSDAEVAVFVCGTRLSVAHRQVRQSTFMPAENESRLLMVRTHRGDAVQYFNGQSHIPIQFLLSPCTVHHGTSSRAKHCKVGQREPNFLQIRSRNLQLLANRHHARATNFKSQNV